mmetsp:Transcript_95706/g.194518  ORF Transcript_95706/g.194518 Transcript_95706/m.194518 type:complete len:124 (-) Transcript_95706:228-599(-)
MKPISKEPSPMARIGIFQFSGLISLVMAQIAGMPKPTAMPSTMRNTAITIQLGEKLEKKPTTVITTFAITIGHFRPQRSPIRPLKRLPVKFPKKKKEVSSDFCNELRFQAPAMELVDIDAMDT